MCCLFGLIDTDRQFTGAEKAKLMHALATASEARGTDATGVAYHADGKLIVRKSAIPGRRFRFRAQDDTVTLMGHTRLTTQGNAKRICNNHPFRGHTANGDFALAHNGIIYNDRELRKKLSLPNTTVETDSYIAVQLIEKRKTLDPSSLKYTAEQVEGSFTFTVLDAEDRLSIIKGDNPLCLYQFPQSGLFAYASTEEILQTALSTVPVPVGAGERITIVSGEIVTINREGQIARSMFDDSKLCTRIWGYPYWYRQCVQQRSYWDELKSMAASFGYSPEDIDNLRLNGYTAEEIEGFLYCGEI